MLFREELGEVLRDYRKSQGRTLREVAGQASVSLGYLSEIERGEKEASSEMLGAICVALDLPLSVVLQDLAGRAQRIEAMSAPVTLPVRTATAEASAA